jgi:pilus assembly protein CpaB
MNVRSLILAFVAVLIAAGAALGVRSLVSGSQTPQVAAAPAPEKPDMEVMVAIKPLPTGHILAIEDVKWVAWPEDGADPQFLKKGADTEQNVVGRVVKVSVAQGAPLLKTQMVGPGERGFLAAVLSKNMRAVTVAVSDTAGVGGFVFPGDRVDLVLTHEVPNGQNLPLRGAETFLTNVRVLAVNEKTDDTGQVGAIPGLRSVTLEVPPPFVEEIVVMDRLGDISLALRPITDSAGAARVDPAAKAKAGAAADPVKAAAAATIASSADMKEPLVMPSDKNKTLTLDRQVSKLVTMARQQSSSGTVTTAGSTGEVRPDITVARGSESDPVSFHNKSVIGAARPASALEIMPTEKAK